MRLADRSFDAIVIGGGHNGLVAACYLAKAGKRVILFEASDHLGGAVTTGEITPDYMISTASHLIEALPRRIEKELKLSRNGLRFAARNLPTIALSRDKRHLVLSSRRRDIAALREWNAHDAAALVEFSARLKAYAAALRPLLLGVPPSFTGPSSDAVTALRRLVWRMRRLGQPSFEDLLRVLPASIGDLVDATFETPLLRAAFAFEALRGTAEGPYSPGTAFNLIYRRALQLETRGTSLPRGGMGALVTALRHSAEGLGVAIRTGAAVRCIIVENNVAVGVETVAGEFLRAPAILSSVDPRATMLDLVGAANIDAGLAMRLAQTSRRGATAKLNLALDGLPTISGLAPAEYGARLLVVPSLGELDQAFASFKRGEVPAELGMEVTIPSVADTSLAPAGHHVMSVLIQHVPYEVAGGWTLQRDRLLDRVIETLARYAPDLRARIIAGEMLLAPDIEAKFGLAGGEWHCGEMRPDQLLMFRPTPELARYRTPLRGLYLCGAGSHPGGISGLAGQLAARTVLSEGGRA
ncbi:NAD(P)/FAD-dependent oxidoreductase [Parvibaculum sp.]|uniref:phytoene desaturase family protein n=1 Tax=Parvibaculum sp. TaxID=2024848 RepID=UPI00320F4272